MKTEFRRMVREYRARERMMRADLIDHCDREEITYCSLYNTSRCKFTCGYARRNERNKENNENVK